MVNASVPPPDGPCRKSISYEITQLGSRSVTVLGSFTQSFFYLSSQEGDLVRLETRLVRGLYFSGNKGLPKN